MPDDDGLSGPALGPIYRSRHEEEDHAWRARVWTALVDIVFQPYIRDDDTVLDLGAGWGEFINAVRCGRKIAVDLNPDVARHVADAEVVVASATDLSAIADGSVDVVFCSNLLEHIEPKSEVLRALVECHRILRPGGTMIALVPNARYLPGRFWDYLDHVTPLTERSLAEAFSLAGFEVLRVVPRFTPYETRSRVIPRSITLVRLYLRTPLAWRFLGKQAIVVGRRPA